MPSGHGDRGPLYGAVGHPQNTAALLDNIAKLKQDLIQSNTEKQTMVEQMNVLIGLIKRSWSGDHNASLHLGNIVGVSPPEYAYYPDKQITNTPVPDMKERVVKNWERMALRLLEMDYREIQREIQARQQKHMLQRQMYMDELLESHEADMARTVGQQARPTHKKVQEVDQRFIKNFNQKRPVSGKKPLSRISSGKKRMQKDPLENKDLTLNDLLVNGQAKTGSNSDMFFTGMMENNHKQRPLYRPMPYDDPQRYKQTNLFDLDTVFGPSTPTNKPRPASAFATTRDKPGTKARPKSAGVFLTQTGERPMKYETTRPVSAKKLAGNKQPQARKGSLRSASEPVMSPMPEAPESNFEDEEEWDEAEQVKPEEADDSDSEDELPQEDHIGKNLRVRVASATNQPRHVEKFISDIKTMQDMEKDFKKSAAQLQKRLGIEEMGMIK